VGEDGALHCDAHPQNAAVPIVPAPAAAERAALELAGFALEVATSPDFAACVERQRRILASMKGVTSLENLEREQPALAVDLHAGGERYALEGGVLECARHPSVQRMAARNHGFSATPVH
jgi:hypothetical protein